MNDRIFIRYTGTSMWPTLAETDLLEVEPYGKRLMKRGDVVLCLPPGETGYVVHRIAKMEKEGILTKGDNNQREDSRLLGTGNIVGQVVFANRGSERRKISGGVAGEFAAHSHIFYRPIVRLFGPAYWFLSRKGTLRRFLKFSPRVVLVESKPRPYAYLLWGKRVIGRFDPKTETWRIDKPFHLLVDEPSVPWHKPGQLPIKNLLQNTLFLIRNAMSDIV